MSAALLRRAALSVLHGILAAGAWSSLVHAEEPGFLERQTQGLLRFVLADLTGEYSNQLWALFAQLFSSPVAVLNDPTVQRLQQIAAMIALGALPAIVAWAALKRMFETMDGTCTTPPEMLIRRCITAGVTVTALSTFAWYAGTLGNYLRDVLAAFGVDISMLGLYFGTFGGGIAAGLLLLVFLIVTGIVILQRAVLTMEFTLLVICGAFMALTLATEENAQPWQVWKREIIAICVTPVLQLLVLLLFARRIAGVDPASVQRWIDSFALLYVLWNTPRWARQFTYKTGVGTNLAGAAGGIARLSIIRRLFTKGV